MLYEFVVGNICQIVMVSHDNVDLQTVIVIVSIFQMSKSCE